LLTAVKRPERFVGLHFFNPVPLMKLVEVVRTIATDEQVFESVFQFAKKLNKIPVRTSDKSGFIVNRLLVPYLLDAIRAYEEGVGSIEDIDWAMRLGCGYPMGPFTLLDFVGLDTTYYITHVMYDEFKERRFAAPPLLKRMVLAGWYGRKNGKGFYDYSNRKSRLRTMPPCAALQRKSARQRARNELCRLHAAARRRGRVLASRSWRTYQGRRLRDRGGRRTLRRTVDVSTSLSCPMPRACVCGRASRAASLRLGRHRRYW